MIDILRLFLLDSFKAWNCVPIKGKRLILHEAYPSLETVTPYVSKIFSKGKKSNRKSINHSFNLSINH